MRVLVVGAGISGLTLACFLRRHERFEVDVIDKAPDWAHLGYTIGIWDIGRRVLAKLDLDDEFDRVGHRIHTVSIADRGMRNVLKAYHLEDFYARYESAYTHISRKALHEILERESGVAVRMGTTLAGLRQHGRAVDVTFSDGTAGSYDLVVGADGLRSQVRELVFGPDRARFAGNRCWYAWIPNRYVRPGTVLEMIGGRQICHLFDDSQQACLILTAPEEPGTPDDPATRVARLQEHFKGFGYPLDEILRNLRAEDLMPTDLGFVDSEDWVRGRVVVIGDAAHAMEPFGGIGASMGMEDAYVLAEELCELFDPTDVRKALVRHVDRRLPRIRAAKRQTRLRYRWLTLEIPGITTLRKLVAPLVPVGHFTKGYKRLLDTPA